MNYRQIQAENQLFHGINRTIIHLIGILSRSLKFLLHPFAAIRNKPANFSGDERNFSKNCLWPDSRPIHRGEGIHTILREQDR